MQLHSVSLQGGRGIRGTRRVQTVCKRSAKKIKQMVRRACGLVIKVALRKKAEAIPNDTRNHP